MSWTWMSQKIRDASIVTQERETENKQPCVYDKIFYLRAVMRLMFFVVFIWLTWMFMFS